MQVQITITNPSFDFLLALGMTMHGTTNVGVVAVNNDTEDGEAVDTHQPTVTSSNRIVTAGDLNNLNLGHRVHWKGAKFEFDAHIEKIGRALSQDDKFVWLRRCDTGKLVSLTLNDLKVGSLTPVKVESQQGPVRIVTADDIKIGIDLDTEVHWKGAKFEFDGVVERIDDEVVSPDAGIEYLDDKAVFIRRNDTGKLVSLTLRDPQTGSLTLK